MLREGLLRFVYFSLSVSQPLTSLASPSNNVVSHLLSPFQIRSKVALSSHKLHCRLFPQLLRLRFPELPSHVKNLVIYAVYVVCQWWDEAARSVREHNGVLEVRREGVRDVENDSLLFEAGGLLSIFCLYNWVLLGEFEPKLRKV